MIMIELDIFSDTVCPWCYIGKKRLENALNKYQSLKIKLLGETFGISM